MSRPNLLLDPMIDAQVANALDQQGWDVVGVSELGLATADDDQIFAMAISQDRVLVTLDEHFGDWAVLPHSTITGKWWNRWTYRPDSCLQSDALRMQYAGHRQLVFILLY